MQFKITLNNMPSARRKLQRAKYKVEHRDELEAAKAARARERSEAKAAKAAEEFRRRMLSYYSGVDSDVDDELTSMLEDATEELFDDTEDEWVEDEVDDELERMLEEAQEDSSEDEGEGYDEDDMTPAQLRSLLISLLVGATQSGETPVPMGYDGFHDLTSLRYICAYNMCVMSMEDTPVDTGNLKASCCVIFEASNGVSVVYYDTKEADYAIFVHECLYVHTIGKNKFLEDSAEYNVDELNGYLLQEGMYSSATYNIHLNRRNLSVTLRVS